MRGKGSRRMLPAAPVSRRSSSPNWHLQLKITEKKGCQPCWQLDVVEKDWPKTTTHIMQCLANAAANFASNQAFVQICLKNAFAGKQKAGQGYMFTEILRIIRWVQWTMSKLPNVYVCPNSLLYLSKLPNEFVQIANVFCLWKRFNKKKNSGEGSLKHRKNCKCCPVQCHY